MSNRGVRIRGALLVVLGIGLAGFMAWLLGEMAPMMQPGGSPTGARFTGDQDEGRLIVNVLTGVLAIGVAFALYGIYMLATGKESKVAKIVAIGLWLLMVGWGLFLSRPAQVLGNLF